MTSQPTPLLIGEVFTSPGPRKRPLGEHQKHDPELGEDTGGVLLHPERAWVWVADGASDHPNVAGYSSRTLAQELGEAFSGRLLREFANGAPDPGTLQQLFEASTGEVLDRWNGRLQEPGGGRETLTRHLESLKRELASSGGGAVFLEFAATFAAACLAGDGRLAGLSVGDALLMANPAGVTQFFALRRGAVTLRLHLKEGAPVFSLFCPQPERFENRQVDLVALSTDGARDTLKALRDGLGPEFRLTARNYPRFRRLLRAASPGTQDDKTLAFAGRLYAG